MDGDRFDDFSRRFAAKMTRRGVVMGMSAGVLGALGLRGAGAQVSQAQCGNVICRTNPGKCTVGCVCCIYPNGNSRCRPPGTCGPGIEAGGTTTPVPTTTLTPPTTTTPSTPTTSPATTTPAPPATTTLAPTTTPTPTTTTPTPTTTTFAPTSTTTTARPTTTTSGPTTTTAAPTTTAPPNPGICQTFEDCPEPPPGNSCRIRQCRNGQCGFTFLPAGELCTVSDPCVTRAVCESDGLGNLTSCVPRETSLAPACLFPCNDVNDCSDPSNPTPGACQKRTCVFDPQIGRGGCQVDADPDKNGASCASECLSCGPQGDRLCNPNGTCQNGGCAQGPNAFTCSPSPSILCCFNMTSPNDRRPGCGLPNGSPTTCRTFQDCCSQRCLEGVCTSNDE